MNQKRRKGPTPKQRVLKKYPLAFGWREFSVSDYSVHSGPGGELLAIAGYAKDAWEAAAKRISKSSADASIRQDAQHNAKAK